MALRLFFVVFVAASAIIGACAGQGGRVVSNRTSDAQVTKRLPIYGLRYSEPILSMSIHTDTGNQKELSFSGRAKGEEVRAVYVYRGGSSSPCEFVRVDYNSGKEEYKNFSPKATLYINGVKKYESERSHIFVDGQRENILFLEQITDGIPPSAPKGRELLKADATHPYAGWIDILLYEAKGTSESLKHQPKEFDKATETLSKACRRGGSLPISELQKPEFTFSEIPILTKECYWYGADLNRLKAHVEELISNKMRIVYFKLVDSLSGLEVPNAKIELNGANEIFISDEEIKKQFIRVFKDSALNRALGMCVWFGHNSFPKDGKIDSGGGVRLQSKPAYISVRSLHPDYVSVFQKINLSPTATTVMINADRIGSVNRDAKSLPGGRVNVK